MKANKEVYLYGASKLQPVMELQNIELTLPVKFSYPVLRQLLEAQLIGTEIGSGERKRGKIVGLSLETSPLPEFDIVLGLKINITPKILLPKEIPIFIHGALHYEPETGRLSVGNFKIDAKSKNLLLD